MIARIKNNKAVLKDTRTKKAKRADAAKQRNTWTIKPITRIKPNAKIYNRNAWKRAEKD